MKMHDQQFLVTLATTTFITDVFCREVCDGAQNPKTLSLGDMACGKASALDTCRSTCASLLA